MLESRKIIVDFGEVEVGTTAVQLLEFRNENYVSVLHGKLNFMMIYCVNKTHFNMN